MSRTGGCYRTQRHWPKLPTCFGVPKNPATMRHWRSQLLHRNPLGVAMVDIRAVQMKANTWDFDDAIAIARPTVNELTNSSEMLILGATTAALVAALLSRGRGTDDEIRYREFREGYRGMATSLDFEGELKCAEEMR